MVCLTRLTDFQRVREQDEEGMAAESAIIKRKVSAPAVRLVGTEAACDACKKVGVAAECVYGTGVACARCKLAKLRCSLAQGRHGQRKPTENETEDEGEITPAQSKGKAHVVPKKTGSKLEAWKTQDTLAHRLNHLHSRLFQIRAKVKELEVEHAVVMSEVSEIVEALKDMDL